MVAKITEAPKHHSQAKHQALIRDGFRCVVTGVYDETARPNVSVEEIVLARGIVNTECAHIVPDSTYFNVGANSSGDKRDHSASVLAVLKRFGYTVDNLNGEKVHSLFNVMTLHHDVHDYFDRLGFWFEKTATPNCYKIRTADPLILLLVLRPHVDRVTFTTPDAVKLPLPSPDLLALHGVCAQVAQLSGAGEYIDRIHEDMEEIGVLASDGTSSDILHHALMTRGSRGITIR
ncbi:hypothetical protein JAAARDRAFT_63505 [Jaapia argillacea MUCL 33604]|uniref:HNH nuclease domain-containing protein n=1 Tax=Jaapia argillacea MUCL 33604 TaxID=933084 RepID=A0A067PFC0_9AGAM|nr:hypothetical protein JAAARDRAFT_63505 [Jaapia argillacea MUCL 33604]